MAAKLFLFVGPSGAGKGTILHIFHDRHPEFHYARSATTRPKRTDDTGLQYDFVSPEIFQKLLAEDALLTAYEFSKYQYGKYKKDLVDALQSGKIVLIESDTYEWQQIEENHPQLKEKLRIIFFVPPSLEILSERIRHRSPLSEEQIKLRMQSAEYEIGFAHLADLQIVSHEGKQEETYLTIEKYIIEQTRN